MKAKLPKTAILNGSNQRNREQVSSWTAAVCYKGEVVTPVECICYMARSASASVVYCELRVWGKCSGSGKAGGGGYHKESAALQEAIDSAGIQLFGDCYGREENKRPARIAGCGDSSMKLALTAITRAAGYRGKITFV